MSGVVAQAMRDAGCPNRRSLGLSDLRPSCLRAWPSRKCLEVTQVPEVAQVAQVLERAATASSSTAVSSSLFDHLLQPTSIPILTTTRPQ